MTRKTFRAACVTGALALAAALGSGMACAPGKGAIMLAVTTDMKAPKDVSVVSLTISTGPAVKFNFIGRVTPDGEVKLPATVAIVEPDDPKATVRIRIIAFQETKPRVLRDVRTTVPRSRTALLRVPLSFTSDGATTGALPAKFLPPKANGGGGGGQQPAEEFNAYDGTVGSSCGATDEITDVGGECKDSTVDSAVLPDYREDLVFGAGGKCFDPKVCFAGAREIAISMDGGDLDACTLTKGADDPTKVNYALVTPDVGECVQAGQCFVPIDQGEGGWTDTGSQIQLPKGVCKKIRAGAKLFASSACAPKPASTPICGPLVADGGTADGGGLTAELFAAANTPSSILLHGPPNEETVLYATDDGLGSKALQGVDPGTVQSMLGQTDMRGQWQFAPADPGTVEIAKDGKTALTLSVVGGTFSSPNTTSLPLTPDAEVQLAWDPYSQAFYYASTGKLARSQSPHTTATALTGSIPSSSTSMMSLSELLKGPYFAIGSQLGTVTACTVMQNAVSCGSPTNIADGQAVTAMAIGGAYGYGFAGAQFWRATPQMAGITGLTQIATVSRDANPSLRLGLATDAMCAYFSTGTGVSYVVHGQTSPAAAAAYAPPAGASILGVAVSTSHIYFAVHAPMTSGGGVYRVLKPIACKPA